MAKLNCVKLEGFMVEFGRLEQNITELNGARNLLEIRLEDSNRLVNFYVNKEQSLRDEKESLLLTVDRLHQTLQEQCDLRVENKKLRMEVEDLKEENERTAEAGRSDVQLLLSQMAAAEDRHQRALEAVKQQSSREVEEAQIQAQRQMEAKDAEVQQQLEEMKTRMKEQERERQSEMLKLQMEFGAKLARVQSSAQRNQQQLHGSNLLPQSVFKRKLQFFQEEKNKEIAALRQRIKELEESQGAVSSSSSYTKRRKF
ncbi:PREDICTED: coiled-coil domain-containing protein 152 isoform X1 [Poecilia mexicana]|uniref:Coiled-coil domain-containing protein 152 n=1 Tax=Poecilia mexicana TaxID=48701 RepID=A0A3B3XDS1_9TELE|nr:PREDICTED: coiled-coil domain-containing protein 152 isoform X1 [Poecilia mexicana]